MRTPRCPSLLPLAVVLVLVLVLACLSLAGPAAAQNGLALDIVEVADELVLPLGIVHAGDGSGRLFLVQQTGEIMIWNGVSVEATPFLDLSDVVGCCFERGLLGLAFHPDYADNGQLYVNYTRPVAGVLQTVVARYQVSDTDPDQVDPTTAEILLVLDQPASNHNGGQMHFGPDGYLYVSTGDGGGGWDPFENAQDLSNLHGNILRLDVDGDPDPGLGYAIPPDNPFVGVAGARDEIWSYGLRNPWRFSFDRQTGDLWIGDVGQFAWEEIDFQPASSQGGENYGWDCREGLHPHDDPNGDMNETCTGIGYTDPVLEYEQIQGRCSVTAGYRYRGSLQPRLRGVFLYADFCTGEIFGTVPRCDGAWESRVVYDAPFFITSFGEDEAGEIYVTERVGEEEPSSKVHRLFLAPGSDGPDIELGPATLDFGTVEVGDTVTLPFTLSNANPGPEALAVTGVVVSDSATFTLEPEGGPAAGVPPCGSGGRPCLPPGAGCAQHLRLQAGEPGELSETLAFGGNFRSESVRLVAEVVPCASAVDLDLTGFTVSDTQTHRACDTVTADISVEASGDLTLRAGTRIALGDGFSVAPGGRLTLETF